MAARAGRRVGSAGPASAVDHGRRVLVHNRLPMGKDIAFEMAVSSVRFGVGVTREVGMDLAEMGARLALVVTDPVLARLPPVRTVLESLDQNKIPYALYDRARVEPSDESFLDAIAFANARPFDAIVAVGGGSVDRHREGRQSLHHVPSCRFSRLREPADRQGAACARAAETAARDSDDRGDGKRDDRRHDFRLQETPRQDRHRQPPAQADARAISIRRTRGPCRQRSPRRPASTF